MKEQRDLLKTRCNKIINWRMVMFVCRKILMSCKANQGSLYTELVHSCFQLHKSCENDPTSCQATGNGYICYLYAVC